MTPEEEADYLARFKVAYDARNHTVIRQHREVNKVAQMMIKAGHSLAEIYRLADQAREYLNMPTIERKKESKPCRQKKTK